MTFRRSGRVGGSGPVLALVLLLTIVVSVSATARAEVQVAGLQVVGPGVGKNGTELQPFRERAGVTLVLLVSPPEGKSIIELDDDESAVSSWTDDQGTNLLEGVSWDPFPDITEDGSAGMIGVSSEARPAAGSSKVQVSGEVAAQVATGTDSETVASLSVAPGQKLETKQGTLEVVGVDTEDAMTLTLQANTKIRDSLRAIRFYDGDEEIEVNGRGSMSMGSSVQLEYYLERAADQLRVELEWWIGLENVKIPFQVEAGLGFSQ